MLPLANKQHFSINQVDLQPTHFHPFPYLGQSLEKQLYSAIWVGWKGYRELWSTAYWWHWSQNLPHFPLLLFMVIALWCVWCFTGKTEDRILECRKSGVFPHTLKKQRHDHYYKTNMWKQFALHNTLGYQWQKKKRIHWQGSPSTLSDMLFEYLIVNKSELCTHPREFK